MTDSQSKLVQHGFRFANWPGGEGPAEAFGITHAIIVPPNARKVVIGGQLGIKDDGSVPENLEDEIREAFDHVKLALKAAGLGDDAWEYVYSVKTFEVKTKDGESPAEKVITIAREYLKGTKPAWTGVEVQALAFPTVHIEITVEAFLPE